MTLVAASTVAFTATLKLWDVNAAKAASVHTTGVTTGTCTRRCGFDGWARSLAIRAEGEEEDVTEDASKIEEDKFFGMPLGYGMGFQMMPPSMARPFALGLPQSFGFFNPYSSLMWILPAPWARPIPPMPAPRPIVDPIYNCMLMKCAQNTPYPPIHSTHSQHAHDTRKTYTYCVPSVPKCVHTASNTNITRCVFRGSFLAYPGTVRTCM